VLVLYVGSNINQKTELPLSQCNVVMQAILPLSPFKW